MRQNECPGPIIYLLVEAGLIMGLAHSTFIGDAFAGTYLCEPSPVLQAIIGVLTTGWLW